MSRIHSVLGNNLVECRHNAGLTQLQVAEKLNYTDKAVSKWERGESVPDISVLKQVASLYGVTVDYLLEETHEEPVKEPSFLRQSIKNRKSITVMSVLLVWLVAAILFLVFFYLKLWKPHYWLFFIYALSVSFIVWLVFNSVWLHPRWNFIIISGLMWTVLLSVFMTFRAFGISIPLIFILGIPGQLIILAWSRIRLRKTPKKIKITGRSARNKKKISD